MGINPSTGECVVSPQVLQMMIKPLAVTKTKVMKKVMLTVLLAGLVGTAAVAASFPDFKKGSFQQIQQQRSGTPYILAFWSETCAYCMQELAMFGRLLKQYPNVGLVTVTTDPFLDENTVKKILTDRDLTGTETWVFADRFAERLYYDIDPAWQGELPLTYFFDGRNTPIKHMGVVKEDELMEWLSQQQ